MHFFWYLRHQAIQEEPGFEVQRADGVVELQAATVSGAWQVLWPDALMEHGERRENWGWADSYRREIDDDVVCANVWRPGRAPRSIRVINERELSPDHVRK